MKNNALEGWGLQWSNDDCARLSSRWSRFESPSWKKRHPPSNSSNKKDDHKIHSLLFKASILGTTTSDPDIDAKKQGKINLRHKIRLFIMFFVQDDWSKNNNKVQPSGPIWFGSQSGLAKFGAFPHYIPTIPELWRLIIHFRSCQTFDT